MEIQRGGQEAAEEPGEPARDHQRADATLRTTLPRHQSTAQQRPPRDQVGHRRVQLAGLVRRPLGADADREPGEDERDAGAPHDRLYVGSVNVASAGADRSAFGMNPRALLPPSRLRYDEASRLEVSTTAGAAPSAAS